ncbi:MAG: sugar phosphate isomerase/epimerase family protein [Faecousia sp.]
MNSDQLYLSTIDPKAGSLARKYGLGVEIAAYCTAVNMDDRFEETHRLLEEQLLGVPRRLFHGPFNELFPCAIDPLARKLADFRFGQALALSERYGAKKLILHGGFCPKLYFPCWYVEQSVVFWRQFLEGHPGDYEICLENVLEEEPELLRSIVSQVDDPRLRLCLDVGHVNAYSSVPAGDWIACWGAYLSHAHLHNNDGTADTHSALNRGTLPMGALISALPENATATLELPEIGENISWLTENALLLP